MMMLLGENVSTHDSNYLSSYTGNEQYVRQMTAIDTIDHRLLTFIDNNNCKINKQSTLPSRDNGQVTNTSRTRR